MYAHVREVLELLIRWVHLIAGIMWIGNSMLFNWLDRNLVMPPDAKPGSYGEIWMVHSGGFYQVEKKQLAPSQLPAQLHWFKWQNGITWMSGISLLFVVYYMGGRAWMLDPGVSGIALDNAIALGVGSLLVSWFAYDILWRSPLAKHPRVSVALCLAWLFCVTFLLTHVLSGRAAYIHVGALLGTVMTGTVWFCILPSQHELIAATREGRAQDISLADAAKQRSIHNNYITFPVLFIMLSNHFPSTYGNHYNWLVLTVLAVSSAGVRHFMNIRFTYPRWLRWALAMGIAGVIGLWMLTLPPPPRPLGPRVRYATVHAIIEHRCTACHSEFPIDAVYTRAPNGVMFDTPDQIRARLSQIRLRAVVARTMPMGNRTAMTDAERDTLGRWIDQGAPME